MKDVVKYIVFDFDGTLADTYQVVWDIVNDLKTDKNKEINFEDIKNRGTRYLIKKAGIPFWRLPQVVHRVMSELKKKTDIKLFPEISDTLKRLKENYKLGIMSSNTEVNIRIVLKRYDIENLFEFVYSDSSIFGKHRVLKRMCKKYKLAPEEMIYVGDEDRDVIAAKRATIRVIAVTWGYNSEQRLIKESPDYLVRTPKQILEYVQGL